MLENHKKSEIFSNRKNYGNDFKVNNLVKNKEFFKKLKQNQILFPKIIKMGHKKTLIKNIKKFWISEYKKIKK